MANEIQLLKKDTADVVALKVRKFQENGELHFPPNYSPDNAIKSAWLLLQGTKDKNDQPVLSVCTKDRIANSLLDMVIQGLSPAKKQCYFIAYGDKLTLMRSYFGTAAVVQRVKGVTGPPLAQPIYEDDEFEYEIKGANKIVLKHTQKLQNINPKKIAGSYCSIEHGKEHPFTEIMTLDEIKQAWKQSKLNPVDNNGNIKAGSTHDKFTQEMAKKTVLNRTCKTFVNTSDDSDLLIDAFNRTTENEYKADTEVEDEIQENANSEIIDIEPEVADEKPKEQPDSKQEAQNECGF